LRSPLESAAYQPLTAFTGATTSTSHAGNAERLVPLRPEGASVPIGHGTASHYPPKLDHKFVRPGERVPSVPHLDPLGLFTDIV